jgi:hypothetical protein
MKTETTKIKPNNILTVKVKVKNNIEAYQIVSKLGFDFEVVSAEINGHGEDFDKKNTPAHFLRDNSKNKKSFRDIRSERSEK